jgi:hypothetical protein
LRDDGTAVQRGHGFAHAGRRGAVRGI